MYNGLYNKQMKKLELFGLLFITSIIFTACGDRAHSQALVGSWFWKSSEWRYTFNQDGTGFRGTLDSRTMFHWSNPQAGQLNIRNDDLKIDEQWNYTILGDFLIIECRQTGVEFSYRRKRADEQATESDIRNIPSY